MRGQKIINSVKEKRKRRDWSKKKGGRSFFILFGIE